MVSDTYILQQTSPDHKKHLIGIWMSLGYKEHLTGTLRSRTQQAVVKAAENMPGMMAQLLVMTMNSCTTVIHKTSLSFHSTCCLSPMMSEDSPVLKELTE